MTPHDYILRYATVFATAFGVSFFLEPIIVRWAHAFGVVDKPDWRKTHEGPVPCVGGLVFFPALLAGLVVALALWPVLWRDRYFGLAAAALIITVAGIWDDIYGMRPVIKLLCQLLAGAILFGVGYRLGNVSIPFVGTPIELGVLDFFITVVGIAAIINAINMLDGLDGLAAGSVCIMCGFLFVNKLANDGLSSGLLLVITMGAALAFLRYNFHPAKVFMGDTGSMVLGLVLAAELLDSASQGAAATTILLPLVILAIPIFDMLRTVVTRAKAARHVFAADKSHLHHQLLRLGLSHRAVVLFIYLMNVYMGMMAIIYQHVDGGLYRGLYLASMGLFLFMAFYLVGMGHRHNGDQAE